MLKMVPTGVLLVVVIPTVYGAHSAKSEDSDFTLPHWAWSFRFGLTKLRFWTADIFVNLNTAIYIKGKLTLSRTLAVQRS